MGKIPVTERVTGHTELIGLLAYPIRHSMSPTMHNEAMKKLGLDYVYVALEVENDSLKDAVQGLRALRMRGCNVSMPNKIEIIQYLDELTPAAELAGAVNTVVNDNGHLRGDTTDGTGCIMAIEERGYDTKGKTVTIVGAGGAATSIISQMAIHGVGKINIFSLEDKYFAPMKERVAKINETTECQAELFTFDNLELLKEKMHESDFFVQATGVGMKPHEGESVIPDSSFFKKDLVVHECIYNPRVTKTMELAQEAGCKEVINGLDMMIYQGAAAFKQFTGHDMPVDYIKDIIL